MMRCISAAAPEAELGKKDLRDSRSSELDTAVKKQKMLPAESLPSDTRNYSVKVHLLDFVLLKAWCRRVMRADMSCDDVGLC